MKRSLFLLEKFISSLAAMAMAGIVVLVFVNVVMRYLMNSGLTWGEEASVSLFVWFIFLGAILAAIEGLHLKVDVFTSKLPEKFQKVCLFISNLFVLGAMSILVIGGYELVIVTHNNVSSATGIPFSFITVSLVVFAVCVIGLTLYQMITGVDLKQLAKGAKK